MRCTYGTHASALSAGGASGEGGDAAEVEGKDMACVRVCVCVMRGRSVCVCVRALVGGGARTSE